MIEGITVLDYILRGAATLESLEASLDVLKEDEAAMEAMLEVDIFINRINNKMCEW